MTLIEQQKKFSQLTGLVINWAFSHGYELVCKELERPQMIQDFYFKTGKSKTKTSYHTKRLALDVELWENGVRLTETPQYGLLGQYWESLHPDCVWGGRFGDRPDTLEVEGWDGGHLQFGGKESILYYRGK